MPAKPRHWALRAVDAQRRALGLSHDALARGAGMDRRRVSHLLAGDNKTIDLVALEQLAAVVGLELELLTADPAKPRNRKRKGHT